MRWATYLSPKSGTSRCGLVVEGRIFGLEQGITVLGLLGDDGARMAEAAARAIADPHEVVSVADVTLCAPIPQPPSIRDGSCFEAHLRAGFGAAGVPFDFDNWYAHPMIYFTNPHGLTGSGASIPAAPGAVKLDYELEVAAIVGRDGTNLDVGEAEEHIAGYCILNDWSARDIQSYEVKFQVGPFKTKDWAMTAGPYFVTKDELDPFRKGNAFDLEVTASVNGRPYSRGNISDMYWSFAELVAYSSRGTWVRAGDHIASGTVGTGCILELAGRHGPEAFPWLRIDDEVVLQAAGLGTLTNRIGKPYKLHPLRRGA
jgi:2-keto-4-pentenoate hydratase/2-oxohepta-3-ene-1,7-dioic acid hydratase in catechol pathway